MHNYDENEVLRDMLSGLNDEVPPMPEELHTAWMQKVEEHMEDHRAANTRSRKAFTHFLSAAAALVFIVGGTLLTRDDLENRARLEKDYAITAASNDQLAYAAKNAAEYRQALADYENAVNGAASNDAGVTAAIYTAASGASYDSVPAPESAEAETGTFTAYGKRSAEAEDAITEESAAETVSTIGEKKIIRTATLTLQTQSYDGSLASLKTMCEAEGGWIENSSESLNSSTGLRRAYLTLRIPQDALDGYIAGTQELGRITSRSETATDVTSSYQDTQARLDTQLALMERLQALITESADLNDLLALESQIADTQYTIDALQSSLNATDRQVTYATISITLREETTPALTDTTVSLSERISAAIRMGCRILTDFTQDVLVFLVAALPFIGIVAAFAVVLTVIRKMKRRNKQ